MRAATAKTAVGFRNILFATDFSDAAARAIPYVKGIAKHYGSNLVVLHARPPVGNLMTPPLAWKMEMEARQELDRQHREAFLDIFAGIHMDVKIEEGDVQSCLQKAIRDHNTDLVVLGTRGRTGLGKLLLGSVAEEIFRSVECPVLTVGPLAYTSLVPGGNLREILFAGDFTPESNAAAKFAISMAQEFQASLVLLHVIPEPEAGDLVSTAEILGSARALLEGLVSGEAQALCRPQYFIERGDPAKKIVEFARMRESDLIVLGAKLEKGVAGAASHLPMATAHKVVSHASCPVLTIRA